VNSQSGKGGVAYLLSAEHGLDLPRAMQVEFSKQVQELTEATGTEISPAEIWNVFTTTYQPENPTIQLLSSEVSADQASTRIFAQLVVNGHHVTVKAKAMVDRRPHGWTSHRDGREVQRPRLLRARTDLGVGRVGGRLRRSRR